MPQHFEKRTLPYTPEQLFDLVMDIESYPDFLPWCLEAQIVERKENELTADLVVGHKDFTKLRETFRSIVTVEKPNLISVRYGGGALRSMNNEWRFAPGKVKGTCDLSFTIDFSMRPGLLGGIVDLMFEKALRKMITAFEQRAKEIYKVCAIDPTCNLFGKRLRC